MGGDIAGHLCAHAAADGHREEVSDEIWLGRYERDSGEIARSLRVWPSISLTLSLNKNDRCAGRVRLRLRFRLRVRLRLD